MLTVTIRIKEEGAPREFPPARLFLDDIEEIVRILVAATDQAIEERTSAHEDNKTTVTFTIKDQICDEVEELPKITRKTTELLIAVERQTPLPATALSISRSDSRLAAFGLRPEAEISLFHKLAPIFKRRNLWFRTLIHSHFVFLAGLSLGSFTAALLGLSVALTLIFVFNKHIPPTRLTLIALLAVLFPITVFATGRYHSIIILHHSSEPSPLRQELLQKVPVAAISSVLTFLLTLLGLYLKHKYWP